MSHHGIDPSGSPLLVHGLQPRVAVMQNGTRKGAGTQAMPTMRSSPGLEDIWQLHWSYGAGIEQNSAGVFIANVEDAGDDRGRADGAAARRRGGGGGGGAGAGRRYPRTRPPTGSRESRRSADGSFTVSNSRNGFSKTYAARPRAR